VDIASALNLLIKFFVDAHLHSSVVNFENVTVMNWEKSPQPVSCVRGDGGNQPLATILSIGIATVILHPIDLMESVLQGLGFLEKCLRSRFVTKRQEDFSHARCGVVDVAFLAVHRCPWAA
jgi:hypothetical protein